MQKKKCSSRSKSAVLSKIHIHCTEQRFLHRSHSVATFPMLGISCFFFCCCYFVCGYLNLWVKVSTHNRIADIELIIMQSNNVEIKASDKSTLSTMFAPQFYHFKLNYSFVSYSKFNATFNSCRLHFYDMLTPQAKNNKQHNLQRCGEQRWPHLIKFAVFFHPLFLIFFYFFW